MCIYPSEVLSRVYRNQAARGIIKENGKVDPSPSLLYIDSEPDLHHKKHSQEQLTQVQLDLMAYAKSYPSSVLGSFADLISWAR